MQFLHQLNHFTPLPGRLNLRQTHRLNLRRQVPDFVQRLVAFADIVVRHQVDDFVGDFAWVDQILYSRLIVLRRLM